MKEHNLTYPRSLCTTKLSVIRQCYCVNDSTRACLRISVFQKTVEVKVHDAAVVDIGLWTGAGHVLLARNRLVEGHEGAVASCTRDVKEKRTRVHKTAG